MAVDKFVLKGSKWVIDKDPDAVLDYIADWTKWLPTGDAILTAEMLTTGGLIVDSVEFNATTVTAWLSGGDVTVEGAYASATYRITTINNPDRHDDRTVYFNVTER
jgi:hypothetical protein